MTPWNTSILSICHESLHARACKIIAPRYEKPHSYRCLYGQGVENFSSLSDTLTDSNEALARQALPRASVTKGKHYQRIDYFCLMNNTDFSFRWLAQACLGLCVMLSAWQSNPLAAQNDLWKAAKRGSVHHIKLALKQGDSPQSRNAFGETPLMAAVAYGRNPEAVRTLIAASASVQATDNNGTTVLMMAAYRCPHLEIIEQLLQAGAATNQQNKAGETALMYAARHNPNPRVIELLLAAGANPRIEDKRGYDAQHLAQQRSDEMRRSEILALLSAKR